MDTVLKTKRCFIQLSATEVEDAIKQASDYNNSLMFMINFESLADIVLRMRSK